MAANRTDRLAFMSLATDEWLADTAHLSIAQCGLLIRAYCHAWRRGGTLPQMQEGALARLLNVTQDELASNWPAISEWFDVTSHGDGATIPKLLPELEWAREQREKKRKGAKMTNEGRRQEKPEQSHSGSQSVSQSAPHSVSQSVSPSSSSASSSLSKSSTAPVYMSSSSESETRARVREGGYGSIRKEIRSLLLDGKSTVKEIARVVGTRENEVYEVRKQLIEDGRLLPDGRPLPDPSKLNGQRPS
jgi:uncharacterized protein YdaU (DUF1376 family)